MQVGKDTNLSCLLCSQSVGTDEGGICFEVIQQWFCIFLDLDFVDVFACMYHAANECFMLILLHAGSCGGG